MFNITAAGAVDREFLYIFWPKTGQNWSKWIDPGYSSYPTKYGLTIFYGDPFHAPRHFGILSVVCYKHTILRNVHLGVYPKSVCCQKGDLENEFLVIAREPGTIIKRLSIDWSPDSLSMAKYGCMATPNMPESVLHQTSKYAHLGVVTFAVGACIIL